MRCKHSNFFEKKFFKVIFYSCVCLILCVTPLFSLVVCLFSSIVCFMVVYTSQAIIVDFEGISASFVFLCVFVCVYTCVRVHIRACMYVCVIR